MTSSQCCRQRQRRQIFQLVQDRRPGVSASSITRARLSASAAACGEIHVLALRVRSIAGSACASSNWRRMGEMAGGRSSPSLTVSNRKSSSSLSPRARNCGSSAAPPSTRGKGFAETARRAARRQIDDDIGQARRDPPPPASIRPAANVSREGRAGRNGERWAAHARRQPGEKGFGIVARLGRADMKPHPVQPHADRAGSLAMARSHITLVEKIACRRIGEQARMDDLHAGIGERRDHRSGTRLTCPVVEQAKIAAPAFIAHRRDHRRQQQQPVHPRLVPQRAPWWAGPSCSLRPRRNPN